MSAQTFTRRGLIEGYYGTPWSHEDRLEMIRFASRYGFNSYFYAPKAEALLHERWQELHPPKEMRLLKELVTEAHSQGCAFYYGISPGLTMQYSNEEHQHMLWGKYKSMLDIGVRHFTLQFDDIPLRLMHKADQQTFRKLSDAQVHTILTLWNKLRYYDENIHLVICPTIYNGLGDEIYVRELGNALPEEIDIFWTGRFVCSPYLLEEDAQYFYDQTGHYPFYWDNYPVNDMAMTAELHIGPLQNRGKQLHRLARGYVANVMESPEISKIALITISNYLAKPEKYVADQAFQEAVREVVGKQDYQAFMQFSDHVRRSFLCEQDSPRLMEKLHQFRFHFFHGDQELAMRLLSKTFTEMEVSACRLLTKMENQRLATEIKGWLTKYFYWSQVGKWLTRLVDAGRKGKVLFTIFHLLQVKRWLRKTNRLPQYEVSGNVMRMLVQVVFSEMRNLKGWKRT
ncbi:protein O-GlcNAcase [Brevibacillus daliensis]|uniref:protein O-GlcNAcase n=1 Tax=Brevibacillus daliensis TaxID=2892995 RepID=UPI001E4C4F4E|nr:protein O-GlcNAcase [Brevibacillus daliensis]